MCRPTPKATAGGERLVAMGSTPRQRPDNSSRLSRRRFIGGLGVTAAGTVAVSAVPTIIGGDNSLAATPADRFGRMFPTCRRSSRPTTGAAPPSPTWASPAASWTPRTPLHEGPIRLITNPELSPNNVDNPTHTAGITFLGQFLDHDMTFDATSPLGVPTTPESSPKARTPALDLDSVYGGGPTASPTLYDADRTKLRIENGGLFEDVPRMSN